jgi:hypothetical protein
MLLTLKLNLLSKIIKLLEENYMCTPFTIHPELKAHDAKMQKKVISLNGYDSYSVRSLTSKHDDD